MTAGILIVIVNRVSGVKFARCVFNKYVFCFQKGTSLVGEFYSVDAGRFYEDECEIDHKQ